MNQSFTIKQKIIKQEKSDIYKDILIRFLENIRRKRLETQEFSNFYDIV
jgi:hypothetical protein